MMLIDLADSFLSQPCDMLIICILSHGEEQGKIVTSDGYFMDAEADVFRFLEYAIPLKKRKLH